jgi:LmbE family N-acetylglucosaminyl deacetylase
MRLAQLLLGVFLFHLVLHAQSSDPTLPDERFKVDLLLVVAHPDDESEIGAYLAKAAFDEHKRIAVVFGTPGNSGGNAVGAEQAASLAAIREIEARRALGYLGITDIWFLGGTDTAGQDVLRSLETWDHGRALGRLIRIVRLTRPSVIATWLPAYSAGENHGDHQAASVLATEAFDLAGDPTQFPEQVTPPRFATGISNLTEGLHPWQPQKLYFFSDASHYDFFKGKGPEYSADAISPSKNESYARLAARECSFHLTQSDSGYLAAESLKNGGLEKTYFAQPSRFVFGKSHVDASVTGDLFEAVKTEALPFTPAPGYKALPLQKPTLSLGGPWHFYSEFWRAHGLQQLQDLVPPEVMVGASTDVMFPVLIEGAPSGTSGTLQFTAPSGWKLKTGTGEFRATSAYPVAREIVASAPSKASEAWQVVHIRASLSGTDLNEIAVRVLVAPSNLPQ